MTELYNNLKKVVTGFAGNMTARKAALQLEHTTLGYTLTGVVLTNKQGDRMVIDMARCNSFSFAKWKELTEK